MAASPGTASALLANTRSPKTEFTKKFPANSSLTTIIKNEMIFLCISICRARVRGAGKAEQADAANGGLHVVAVKRSDVTDCGN